MRDWPMDISQTMNIFLIQKLFEKKSWRIRLTKQLIFFSHMASTNKNEKKEWAASSDG